MGANRPRVEKPNESPGKVARRKVRKETMAYRTKAARSLKTLVDKISNEVNDTLKKLVREESDNVRTTNDAGLATTASRGENGLGRPRGCLRCLRCNPFMQRPHVENDLMTRGLRNTM